MNQLILIFLVFILFIYFGGKYVPSVLKKNKNLLLGVAGGLVLYSFYGMRIEGAGGWDDDATTPGSCGANYIEQKATEISDVCCKDKECEVGGYPDECSRECSDLFMAFYNDCEVNLNLGEANTAFYEKCRANYDLSGVCPPLVSPGLGRWQYHLSDGNPVPAGSGPSGVGSYAELQCDPGSVPRLPQRTTASSAAYSSCFNDNGFLNWTEWKNECIPGQNPQYAGGGH